MVYVGRGDGKERNVGETLGGVRNEGVGMGLGERERECMSTND